MKNNILFWILRLLLWYSNAWTTPVQMCNIFRQTYILYRGSHENLPFAISTEDNDDNQISFFFQHSQGQGLQLFHIFNKFQVYYQKNYSLFYNSKRAILWGLFCWKYFSKFRENLYYLTHISLFTCRLYKRRRYYKYFFISFKKLIIRQKLSVLNWFQ